MPVTDHNFFHHKDWKQLDTDVNTVSLLHNMEWIPDCARALFNMVQAHSEPKPSAVASVIAAVTIMPSLCSALGWPFGLLFCSLVSGGFCSAARLLFGRRTEVHIVIPQHDVEGVMEAFGSPLSCSQQGRA